MTTASHRYFWDLVFVRLLFFNVSAGWNMQFVSFFDKFDGLLPIKELL